MKNFRRARVPALLALLFSLSAAAAVAAQEPQPTSSPSPAPQAEPPPPQQQSTQTNAAGADTSAAAKDARATVYIYRPKKLVGAALEPSVFCDGVELGRMDNGRYIMLRLEPGTHRLHMTEKNKRVEETLKPGQVLYVRVRIEMGMWKGHGTLHLADEEDARKDLKDLKPLGADKVKDKTLIVPEAEADAETQKRAGDSAQVRKN